MTLHDGKYGPYIKCGKINASLMGNHTIENLSKEEAITLIVNRKNKLASQSNAKLKKKKI